MRDIDLVCNVFITSEKDNKDSDEIDYSLVER